MTRESPSWTEESKLVLESQLLLATEGPLCLDPSIEVAQVANQLQFNKNKFHTRGIRRYVKQAPLSDFIQLPLGCRLVRNSYQLPSGLVMQPYTFLPTVALACSLLLSSPISPQWETMWPNG